MAIHLDSGKSSLQFEPTPQEFRKLLVGMFAVTLIVCVALFWDQIAGDARAFLEACQGFVRGFGMPKDSAEYQASWDVLKFYVGASIVVIAVVAACKICESYGEYRYGSESHKP